MTNSENQHFYWGVSSSAFQSEGAFDKDEKGESIWDRFSEIKGKIKNNHHARISSDFYHRYPEDLKILQELAIPNFRFSVSWPRILPKGSGHYTAKGIDFYNKVIDSCLELGITPWLTCYHWDLPQSLEDKGGWTSRDIVHYFKDYVDLLSHQFGDRVKHWMVLNEPMAFTGAGYFLGIHAPGRKSFSGFLKAVHHATLAQAEGGRVLRANVVKGNIGTCFSTAHIEPKNSSGKNLNAAVKLDALFNRLFLEPALGLGYPLDDLKLLKRIRKYMLPGDEKLMEFDFDFIGVQNYTRYIATHSWTTPLIHAKIISPEKFSKNLTTMNWEIYPEGIYKVLSQFSKYPQIKSLIVTENGAAFKDIPTHNFVHDQERISFLNNYISQVLKAKKEGLPINGYFVWSLTDNFEWAEGYHPRFGIIYVDFETQERIIKDSGFWYSEKIKETLNSSFPKPTH